MKAMTCKVWKRLCVSKRGTSLIPGLMRMRIRVYTDHTFEIVLEKKKHHFQGRSTYPYPLKQTSRTNTNVVEEA